MENPHQQTPSDNPIQRIHEFAKDLAFYVSVGTLKSSLFLVTYGTGGASWVAEGDNREGHPVELTALIKGKWNNEPPSEDTLLSFGYIQHPPNEYKGIYLLTPKAFELLEKPFKTPTVFISYRRIIS